MHTSAPHIRSATAPWTGGHPLDLPGPWEAVWALPEEDVWAVSAGRARVLCATSPNEIPALLAAAGAPISDVPPTLPGPWFGGMAFDPARFSDRWGWTGYAPARWVLPREIVWRRQGRAWRTTFEAEGEAPMPSPRAQVPGRRELEGDGRERPTFLQAVGAAGEAIGRGALEKVVLARSLDLKLDAPVDPAALLRRLAERYPGCRLFLVRGDDGSLFCGASPETLCRISGRLAETDVLAGSRPPAAPDFEAKERLEHDVVARFILSSLGAFASHAELPPTPRVRALPNILHLYTPIRATLRPEVTPGEVALALHPTPAVGGFPRAEALAFIAEHEGLDRGWYAGPVGCVGANGLELAVALRCALIRGTRARLFAGAGVVHGSQPEAEWEETRRKMLPLLEALGGER
ncbi:MAG TPA: isochorismate synthase [Myxococcaceae bacterium]|nr:isochorismate synthase [Myxococcaceae bacterium]